MMRHQAAPRARATVAGLAAAVLVVGTAGVAFAQSPSAPAASSGAG
jgi:hypothetical protein